jgi:hypothetical protein
VPAPTLADAIKLVRSIETAERTGQGEFRSNEVVRSLVEIAKVWIAEQVSSEDILIAS